MNRAGCGAPFIGLTAEMRASFPAETAARRRALAAICTGALARLWRCRAVGGTGRHARNSPAAPERMLYLPATNWVARGAWSAVQLRICEKATIAETFSQRSRSTRSSNVMASRLNLICQQQFGARDSPVVREGHRAERIRVKRLQLIDGWRETGCVRTNKPVDLTMDRPLVGNQPLQVNACPHHGKQYPA